MVIQANEHEFIIPVFKLGQNLAQSMDFNRERKKKKNRMTLLLARVLERKDESVRETKKGTKKVKVHRKT